VGGGPEKLLAKSIRAGRDAVTLEKHANDTEQAAVRLFGPESRWGTSFRRFFRVPDEESARFVLHLRVAALFHDLGKANEDFLAAVTRTRTEPQTVRHEHLSALVLHLAEVKTWLSKNSDLDHDVLTAAVLSHHVKASNDGDYQWCEPQGGKDSVALYLEHAEVRIILERVRDVAGLPAPPALPSRRWSATSPWLDALKSGKAAAKSLGRALRTPNGLSQGRRALLLATKAGVIAADAAASAVVREGLPLESWIDEVARRPALSPNDIHGAVVAPRTHEIVKRTGEPYKSHRFQDAAAELGPRALLRAACGAGKTLAAWKWAEAQAQARDIGRVIFLYPTRGTATEGFRDYVAAAPDGEAALVHASSRYELEAMLDNPVDHDKAERHRPSESDERLFALGLWSRTYFSATADQFLGFLEHAYRSLCLVPVLADAAVIIDEVHSFDARMFETLLALLEHFDVPVLCMTATLPPARRQSLESRGLITYPRKEHRAELQDLEKLEGHPRYRIEQATAAEACLDIAASAFQEGKRVLWVVNQVARAQVLARKLEAKLGIPPLCYHSRFKQSDRQDIHRETVAAFQQVSRAAIAVTTQVCEMSLDLDADVLITERAPISALVQRFGRANRKLARGLDFRARVIVYSPENDRPYEKAELEAAKSFLDAIGSSDASQRLLSELLEHHASKERAPASWARFLYEGYYATPGAFRDIEERSRPCILDVDLGGARELYIKKKALDGLVVSVPLGAVSTDAQRPSWLPGFYGIADGTAYDKRLGFLADAAKVKT
jgi:CRISPR-associated endonuclease/helicase Cas3